MDESSTDHDPSSNLDSIAQSTDLDLYLTGRESDLMVRTRRSDRYVVERFVEWCANNDIVL